MSKMYAVMESVGNWSHTLEEFDNEDNASEFMLDRATEDALESYIEGTRKDEICSVEWEESLELALSYYAIEVWGV